MFEYDLVRRLHYREGLSRHEIAPRTGLHQQTIVLPGASLLRRGLRQSVSDRSPGGHIGLCN